MQLQATPIPCALGNLKLPLCAGCTSASLAEGEARALVTAAKHGYSMGVVKKAFSKLLPAAGALLLSCGTPPEATDDFARLRTFESDLVQLSVDNPQLYTAPRVETKLVQGYVRAITITGRGLNKLPASIYQFHHLTELALQETAFSALPDLTPFPKLTKLTVVYNLFRGPVQLRQLPRSLECLVLDRDAITDVIVEDSLPKLSRFSLTQNWMRSCINPTFCKLPHLAVLDLSAGCCTTDSQRRALERAAKQVLCNKEVVVRAAGRFID